MRVPPFTIFEQSHPDVPRSRMPLRQPSTIFRDIQPSSYFHTNLIPVAPCKSKLLLQSREMVTCFHTEIMKKPNKPVDATARSLLVRATSTPPPHHL